MSKHSQPISLTNIPTIQSKPAHAVFESSEVRSYVGTPREGKRGQSFDRSKITTDISNYIFPFKVGEQLITINLKQKMQRNQSIFDQDVVWPSASALSRFIESKPQLFEDKTILELGAGAGLPGCCAAAVGAAEVFITDHPNKLLFTKESIEEFQLTADAAAINTNIKASPLELGIRVPFIQTALQKNHQMIRGAFNIILATDLMFEHSLARLLLSTLLQLVDEHTIVYIGHTWRRAMEETRSFALFHRAFSVTEVQIPTPPHHFPGYNFRPSSTLSSPSAQAPITSPPLSSGGRRFVHQTSNTNNTFNFEQKLQQSAALSTHSKRSMLHQPRIYRLTPNISTGELIALTASTLEQSSPLYRRVLPNATVTAGGHALLEELQRANELDDLQYQLKESHFHASSPSHLKNFTMNTNNAVPNYSSKVISNDEIPSSGVSIHTFDISYFKNSLNSNHSLTCSRQEAYKNLVKCRKHRFNSDAVIRWVASRWVDFPEGSLLALNLCKIQSDVQLSTSVLNKSSYGMSVSIDENSADFDASTYLKSAPFGLASKIMQPLTAQHPKAATENSLQPHDPTMVILKALQEGQLQEENVLFIVVPVRNPFTHKWPISHPPVPALLDHGSQLLVQVQAHLNENFCSEGMKGNTFGCWRIILRTTELLAVDFESLSYIASAMDVTLFGKEWGEVTASIESSALSSEMLSPQRFEASDRARESNESIEQSFSNDFPNINRLDNVFNFNFLKNPVGHDSFNSPSLMNSSSDFKVDIEAGLLKPKAVLWSSSILRLRHKRRMQAVASLFSGGTRFHGTNITQAQQMRTAGSAPGDNDSVIALAAHAASISQSQRELKEKHKFSAPKIKVLSESSQPTNALNAFRRSVGKIVSSNMNSNEDGKEIEALAENASSFPEEIKKTPSPTACRIEFEKPVPISNNPVSPLALPSTISLGSVLFSLSPSVNSGSGANSNGSFITSCFFSGSSPPPLTSTVGSPNSILLSSYNPALLPYLMSAAAKDASQLISRLCTMDIDKMRQSNVLVPNVSLTNQNDIQYITNRHLDGGSEAYFLLSLTLCHSPLIAEWNQIISVALHSLHPNLATLATQGSLITPQKFGTFLNNFSSDILVAQMLEWINVFSVQSSTLKGLADPSSIANFHSYVQNSSQHRPSSSRSATPRQKRTANSSSLGKGLEAEANFISYGDSVLSVDMKRYLQLRLMLEESKFFAILQTEMTKRAEKNEMEVTRAIAQGSQELLSPRTLIGMSSSKKSTSSGGNNPYSNNNNSSMTQYDDNIQSSSSHQIGRIRRKGLVPQSVSRAAERARVELEAAAVAERIRKLEIERMQRDAEMNVFQDAYLYEGERINTIFIENLMRSCAHKCDDAAIVPMGGLWFLILIEQVWCRCLRFIDELEGVFKWLDDKGHCSRIGVRGIRKLCMDIIGIKVFHQLKGHPLMKALQTPLNPPPVPGTILHLRSTYSLHK